MTVVGHTNAVLELALDALAHNQTQARVIHDPSPEIDSLAEHLVAIARVSTGETRTHALAALRLARSLQASNRAERACEQAIAPLADPLTRRRGIKAAYLRLRDPLAVLGNPVITGRPREQALAEVAAVIAEFDPEVLASVHLRNYLRVAKYTLLLQLVAETKARRS